MKSFLIALQFLTTLPIKITGVKGKDFGRSLAYFPIVGALIGLMLALSLFIFSFLPSLVMAALIVAISVFITGGLHLDGLADTCDGFYGSKPKEKVLEIMRDSRLGAMGAIGIACVLLLKFALIASIPPDSLWKFLILAPVFSRWSQVTACFMSDYAREEGRAKHFISSASKAGFIAASLFTVILFFLLMKTGGVFLLAASSFAVFLFINYVKKRIGGMTGDTIGATNEIAEVAVLFFALVYLEGQCLY
ncbi:MAG: adenosylcobinamide-GDP ribazoletransferase [Candidatus Omnitrophica bacterium]|nr:adenosylcobinamide-GDP ribazoletransferase [Candidatus Omnitrophota bacterium]